MSGNQRESGAGRARGTRSGRWRTRLGWIPVPLAAVATVVGWLVLGSLPSTLAATQNHHQGYQAGGLALTVDQMGWMSNDMTGQGPLKVPQGFPMDPSEMPGMQPVGDNRLRLEAELQNTTSSAQRYALSDFQVVAPGGKSWPLADDGGNATPASAVIQPGFQVTVDMYFDIPSQQSTNLSVRWSRNGSTVEIPVNIIDTPSPHVH